MNRLNLQLVAYLSTRLSKRPGSGQSQQALQEDPQDLVLLCPFTGNQFGRFLRVFGQLGDVAESCGHFVSLPAFKQVDDVHVDAGKGLCT